MGSQTEATVAALTTRTVAAASDRAAAWRWRLRWAFKTANAALVVMSIAAVVASLAV
jgi:hypothetical protein